MRTIFAEEPKQKRQLGKQRRKWENNIKVKFRVIVCDDVYWIRVTQYRRQCLFLVKAEMSIRVS